MSVDGESYNQAKEEEDSDDDAGDNDHTQVHVGGDKAHMESGRGDNKPQKGKRNIKLTTVTSPTTAGVVIEEYGVSNIMNQHNDDNKVDNNDNSDDNGDNDDSNNGNNTNTNMFLEILENLN